MVRQRGYRDRIAATSYRAMPADTPALRDSADAAIGIRTNMSQKFSEIRERYPARAAYC
jgi:hypothetical protein